MTSATATPTVPPDTEPPIVPTPAARTITSPLRMWAYCAVLTALAFVQDPGRIVADTKLDLVVDPATFLGRSLHLWDSTGAFGQVQNQAYGYLWPMGPFFAVGDLLGLAPWVVQRLWWSLLLCVGFVGVVKLCRALGLGTPASHVLAGAAYVLSVHSLTVLGPTSIEAWPTMLAPWVLLPLVRASREGSVIRGAALSALALAMCGGVNAVATWAVLPLGVVWLVTRTPGRRRWTLFAWWTGFSVLATLWWLLPLLLLGRYSPPFLDYIENAPVTTRPTGLVDVFVGSSDWVAYASASDWRAGHLLATTPFLIADAVVLAGLGLAGILRRDNPHLRFLMWSVLVGLVLITFGYTGTWHGWLGDQRQDLLDHALAPFRNLHKFDLVLRLPLVLGLAHFASVVRVPDNARMTQVVRAAVGATAAVAVVGISTPALIGHLAPAGSFGAVPAYWNEAADYLAAHDGSGRALEVPAAGFGQYQWGSTHDDVLQPLASSPWASRTVIPLAQPGNLRFLDAVTGALEAGRPNDDLAPFLAANGVSTLVVRNDLDLFATGAPDPVVVHQVLDHSAGFTKVAEFGPQLGGETLLKSADGTRALLNRGRQASYPAVEIYRVDETVSTVQAQTESTVPVLYGDPGTGLLLDASTGRSGVLAGDAPASMVDNARILTDGLQRRENFFGVVRDNTSATLAPDGAWSLPSVQHNYRLFEDQDRYETTSRWQGVAAVTASSSQADADAVGLINRARAPAAAFDGDRRTWWQSTGLGGAVGQWWRVDFGRSVGLSSISVDMGPAIGPAIRQFEVRTDAGQRLVAAPPPNTTGIVALPPGGSRGLELRVHDVVGSSDGVQVAIRDVKVPGVSAVHLLQTPATSGATAPARIILSRDPSTSPCSTVEGVVSCDDAFTRNGEDGDQLNRRLVLGGGASYAPSLTTSVRPSALVTSRVSASLPVRVTTSGSLSRDVRAGGLAAVDDDLSTTWVADARDTQPFLRVQLRDTRDLSSLSLRLVDRAAASRPKTVLLSSGGQSRLVTLGPDGFGRFRPMRVRHLRVEIRTWQDAFSIEGNRAVPLPPGITELELGGVPVMHQDAPLRIGCGAGPAVTVNGAVHETRLTATLGDVMSGRDLPVQFCDASSLPLDAGVNDVTVDSSKVLRPERFDLRAVGVVVPPAQDVPTAVTRWGSTERSIALPPRDTAVLLSVAENVNDGWVATLGGATLPVVRVDGWKQGWLVPPGDAGQVQLRFTPDPAFRLALVIGLATLLLVLAATRIRRGASGPPLSAAGWKRWDLPLAVLALGLVGGWLAVGAATVTLVVIAAARRASNLAVLGLVVGAAVAVAGLGQALARQDQPIAVPGWGQGLAVVAVACFVTAAVANGPTFFNRSKGRSST